MTPEYRFFFRWDPRVESARDVARTLAATFAWLRTAPGFEGEWSVVHGDPLETVSCDAVEAIERCVVLGAPPRAPGDSPPFEIYRQHFYLGSIHRYRAKLRIDCGVPPIEGISHAAPNSVALSVRGSLLPAALRQIAVGLIAAYRPVSGFCAGSTFPQSTTSAAGAPTAGWLTYLSSWFGAPAALPAPARVSNLGNLGALYQAFPGQFDPNDADQCAALVVTGLELERAGASKLYWVEAGAPR